MKITKEGNIVFLYSSWRVIQINWAKNRELLKKINVF